MRRACPPNGAKRRISPGAPICRRRRLHAHRLGESGFSVGRRCGRGTRSWPCVRSNKDGKLLWSRDVAKGVRRDERKQLCQFVAFDRRKAGSSSSAPATWCVTISTAGRSLGAKHPAGLRAVPSTGPSAAAPCSGAASCTASARAPRAGARARPEAGRGIESYLLALDPGTGRTLWRHVRRPAAAESQESHTTPLPVTYQRDRRNY